MSHRFESLEEPLPDDLFDELHGLITARFTEQITLEQLKRLEQLVLHDEEARRMYVLYVHDLANLRRMLRAGAANEKPSEARELDSLRESILAWRLNARGRRAAGAETGGASHPGATGYEIAGGPQVARGMERQRQPKPVKKSWRWKAAGIGLLLGGLAAAMALLRPAPTATAGPTAVLTETLDAAWEDEQGESVTVPANEPLGPRRLRLVRGVATLAIGADTVVLLDGREAATSFEIRADGGGQLHFGRLTLRANPKSAAHYAIALPGNVRLMHGTEFGVVVEDDGQSEVHVIDGSVEALRIADDGTISSRTRIARRTAVTVRPAARQAVIEVAQSSFDRGQFLLQVPDQTLEQTARASDGARRGAWTRYAETLRRDAALVYYIDGPASGLGDERLATGRFGERSAVSFARLGDELAIDDPSLQLTGEMTVAVWLNPDRARSQSQGFAMVVGKGSGGGGATGENRNYTLFLAPSATGHPRFEFSINEQGTDENRFIQGSVVGARQWHLVVGVLRQGRMYLYCNGRLAADPLPIEGPKTSDEPLLIGRSQHPQIQAPFQGKIDMIAILKRGMTDAEIQAMYTAGRP
jgi:hypothetical protein